MITRKEKFQKNNRQLKVKILIGVLFLIVSIGGGMGVAFADSDINGLLTNWFSKKGTESISSIEQAVMTEKDKQKERLKQELQIELQKSQEQLSSFTEEEKEKRIQEIRDYADQLIANIKIDNSGKKQGIINQFNTIVEQAKASMDQLAAKHQGKDDSKDNGTDNSQGNSKDNDNGKDNSQGNSNDNGKDNSQGNSNDNGKGNSQGNLNNNSNENSKGNQEDISNEVQP